MGEPILSDIEYDKLEKHFKFEYPDDIHSKQPWSFDECPEELLKKYNLSRLICNPTMGYMAESIYSINNEEEFNEVFRGLNERSRLSFKIDGWNTRVSYFNGNIVNVETRGRSGTNLDIKNVYKLFPQKIPIKARTAITGEMSIPNDKWEAFKMITGNNDQRASVRSALARSAVDYLSFLAFNMFVENGDEVEDQYKVLESLGFKSPKFVWVNNFEELKKYIWYMSYINRAYGYLTDGLVIENSQYQYAIRLGAWEEHAMHSFVEGYEENQGMYGTFLKVKCYPISVEGKTFPRISINNIANIVENNLQVGYPIAFNLRSSANVVLDTTETAQLQQQWSGRYEAYRDMIRKQN
jgi:NAD-dependent DNA ligase